MRIERLVVLVPAYRPDAALAERIRHFRTVGFTRILVVDDGSGPAFRGVFAAAAAVPGVTVLGHAANRGKGAALKTGFRHILENVPEAEGVVTADADGQLAPEDCRRVAEALDADTVVLGVRDFRLGRVPFRSWWGNTWTACLFALLYGRRVPDTQTGLRGLPRALLALLASLPGDGYEYETAVLCQCVRHRVPFACVRIATLYTEGNATSHFDPWRDTVRIHRVLFAHRVRRVAAWAVLALALLAGACSRRTPARAPAVKHDPDSVRVTGYCNCGTCCSWRLSWFGFGAPVHAAGPLKGRPKQVGVTAAGTRARYGTIAADPKVFPFGTRLYVPGYGTGVVEDVGGAIRGRHIDVWFPSHAAAHAWGSRWLKVQTVAK